MNAAGVPDLTGSGAQALESDDPGRIGPYRIVGVLGEGGMGRVFLGLSAGGDAVRCAAVKVIRPEFARDPDFLGRFAHEQENLARLPPDLAAAPLAADPAGRPPWFATAYIPGVDLDRARAAAPEGLPAGALWRLLHDVARVLDTVHGLGLVHRDLKPANVMLTLDGLRVIDFGVARATDQTRHTRTGQALGTPAYMAPEQALGREPTAAVDVFALGGLVCFAAGGGPPFGTGSGPDVLFRVVHEPPSLEALAGVDAELAEVVASCLAKEPGDRPTAAHLIARAAPHLPVREPGTSAVWPPALTAVIAERLAFADRVRQAPGVGATKVLPPLGPVSPEVTGDQPASALLAPTLTAVASGVVPRRRRALRVGVPVLVGAGLVAGVAVWAVLASGVGAPTTSDSAAPTYPVAAPGLPASAPSTADAADAGPTPGQWYQVVNASTGKCVDATDEGTTDGTAVQQWACTGNANQEWQFVPTANGYFKVLNRNAPGLAWDVTGGPSATADGTRVQLWTYSDGTNQQWRPIALGGGIYEFAAEHSGSCLDVTDQSDADGALLQQWACSTDDVAQRFRLVPQS